MAREKRRAARGADPATRSFEAGCALVRAHPIFEPFSHHVTIVRAPLPSVPGWRNLCPPEGWAVVTAGGGIHAHPTRRGEPAEWARVLAHCLLHLGFGHFPVREPARAWNAACCAVVERFLAGLRFGRSPYPTYFLDGLGQRTEEELWQRFQAEGVPALAAELSTAGPGAGDLRAGQTPSWGTAPIWPRLLGAGLAQAVVSAVEVAAGRAPALGAPTTRLTPAEAARQWFISSYPMLGALAATFRVVEDPRVCQGLSVSVAAVDPEAREIYVNPAAGLTDDECRFVLAHELLHVGLAHGARCQGRDALLWNVACDYVVNGWLVELGVGSLPAFGALHDPQLKGVSAEALYDRLAADLRRWRRVATLRGVGLGDLLPPRAADWWDCTEGMDLDAFYRRCLAQGLEYHQAAGRGLLPAGLVEEVQAIARPPIPWDVELARWFDRWFAPLETRRSYARPSRRQSAAPDIPRPRHVPPPDVLDGRTFGVVLDTSGSMDRALLARALGAIAGYATAHDVHAVRVVFCDAATYDQGYLPPEAIAGRVRVRGRGGTMLQPAIDLLERADDFPRDGPLLIITDGACDRLRVRREHAFLVPMGARLPFVPLGPVFRLR